MKKSKKIKKIGCEEFKKFITSLPEDKFAKTFLAKANAFNQWNNCFGYYCGEELMGAIIFTYSKRLPLNVNLQLLHTFAKHRFKGIGRKLCLFALRKAIENKAVYMRISAEPTAIGFYKKLGVKFLGLQKSSCQLAMFKLVGENYEECSYEKDEFIKKCISRNGRGKCIKLF